MKNIRTNADTNMKSEDKCGPEPRQREAAAPNPRPLLFSRHRPATAVAAQDRNSGIAASHIVPCAEQDAGARSGG